MLAACALMTQFAFAPWLSCTDEMYRDDTIDYLTAGSIVDLLACHVSRAEL